MPLEYRTRERSKLIELKPSGLQDAIATYPSFRALVLDHLASLVEDLSDPTREDFETLHQYFPQFRPLPLTWRMEADSTVRVLACTCSSTGSTLSQQTYDAISKRFPPKVTWRPDGKYLLLMSSFSEGKHETMVVPGVSHFRWHEVAVVVPVEVEDSTGLHLYVAMMSPDNVMVTFQGRELTGLPKVVSKIYIDRLDPTQELHRLVCRFGADNALEVAFERMGLLALAASVFLSWLSFVNALNGAPLGWKDSIAYEPKRLNPVAKRMVDDFIDQAPPDFRPIEPFRQLLYGVSFVTDVFELLKVVSWKRSFNPKTICTLTSPGTVTWKKKHFHIDQLCRTRFETALSWIWPPTATGAFKVVHGPETSSDLFPIDTVTDYGWEVTTKMTVGRGKTLWDYIAAASGLSGSEKSLLDWGY